MNTQTKTTTESRHFTRKGAEKAAAINNFDAAIGAKGKSVGWKKVTYAVGKSSGLRKWSVVSY